MIQHIIIFIISLASIDLFNIVYKAYKKLWLKRINFAEKNKGVSEEELTTYEDVVDKKVFIIYAISAIVCSFYVNFIHPEQMNDNFFENLIINFEYVFLPVLIYITCSIVWGYIKGVFDFIKGVKQSFDIEESENEIEETVEEETDDMVWTDFQDPDDILEDDIDIKNDINSDNDNSEK